MVNRVEISINGLRISKPTFDVLTATPNQLQFDSDYSSMPIIQKSYIQLATTFTTKAIIYHNTYTKPPMSSIFWSSTSPDLATSFYQISSPHNYTGWLWPTSWNFSSGDSTYFHIDKFSDRIEFYSTRDHSSGASASVFTGYVTALIYDNR